MRLHSPAWMLAKSALTVMSSDTTLKPKEELLVMVADGGNCTFPLFFSFEPVNEVTGTGARVCSSHVLGH